MGGIIAQEYALAYGDNLRSLILCATFAEPGPFCLKLLEVWEVLASQCGIEATVRDVLLCCFTPGFYEEQPELAKEFDEGVATIGQTAEGFLSQLAAARDHNATDRVADISTPTLVLAGEEDILIPNRQSLRIHEHMPGSEWLTVPGGHAACWEFPDTFNDAVLRFIGRHRGS